MKSSSRRNANKSMKSSKIFLIVAFSLFFLVVSFSEITFLLEEEGNSSFNSGREILQSNGGETRTNPVTKETISDKFCGIEPSGSTHCPAYLSWLLVTAGGPGIVMACLSFAGFFIYAIFHAIACGCCNFGETRCLPPPEGSKLRFWIAKLFVFGSTIAVIVCLGFAVVTNMNVNKTVTHIEGTIINTTVAFNNTINTIVADLSPLNYTRNIVDYTIQAQGYVRTANEKTSQVKIQVDKYNGYRSIIFIVSFALPVGFGILGSIAGCFNIRVLTVIIGFVLFFNSVLLWISFAAHNSVSFAFGDVCQDVLGFAGSRAKYVNASTSIGVIIDCANGTNIFGDLIEYVTNATNTALNTTCKNVEDLCGRQYVYCENSTCSRSTLPSYRGTIISEPNGVQCRFDTRNQGRPICPYDQGNPFPGCDGQSAFEPCDFRNHTLLDCPSQCNSSQLRSSTSQILEGLNSVIIYERVIFEQVFPVLNCTIIQDAFDDLQHSMCDDLRKDSSKISTISAVDAGLLIPMTVGCLIGWLTYRKPEDEGSFELYDRK